MRHRHHGRKLGRTTAHRKAMFRNQLTALFTHDRIVTTLAKAKELRPLAERMVTLARTGSLPARRKVLTMVPDKEVVTRLFDDIAPRFAGRNGGYTRIMRLGRRHGDNAELAIIEFIDYELSEHEEAAGGDKSKGSLMDRAKGLFGGGAKAAAETGAGASEAEPDDVAEVDAEAAPGDEIQETATDDEPGSTEDEIEAAEPEIVEPSPAEADDETVAAAPEDVADEVSSDTTEESDPGEEPAQDKKKK